MICEICLKQQASDKHHKYSQTKLNKKLYKDFIHHEDNIVYLCNGCHLHKSIPKWTEIEFCIHFDIIPRTKSGRQKWPNFTQNSKNQ